MAYRGRVFRRRGSRAQRAGAGLACLGALTLALTLVNTQVAAAQEVRTPTTDAAVAPTLRSGLPAGLAVDSRRLTNDLPDYVDRPSRGGSSEARSGRSAASVQGWHTINVIRVKTSSGRTARVDDARIRQAIAAVDDFYRITTAGRIRVRVGTIVPGWVKASSPCYLSSAYAGARKYRLKNTGRQHVMAYTAADCPFAGLGERPGNHFTVTRLATSFTIAHEFGHNLGLDHSNGSRCTLAFHKPCTPAQDAARHREYGDSTDIMGGADEALESKLGVRPISPGLSPVHLQRLGLLPAKQVASVAVGALGTIKKVTLVDRRSAASGVRYLSLSDAYGTVWISLVDGGLVVQRKVGSYPLALNAHGEPAMSPYVPYSEIQGPLPGAAYPLAGGARLLVSAVAGGRVTLSVLPASTRDATNVTVSPGPSSRSATVTWKAGNDPSITGWRVTAVGPRPGAFELLRVPQVLTGQAQVGGSVDLPADSRTAIVRDLPTKSGWRVVVRALRGAAVGAPSASDVVHVRQAPSWRPVFHVSRTNQRLTVRWDAPADVDAEVDLVQVTLGSGAAAEVNASSGDAVTLVGPTGPVTADVFYSTGEWTRYSLGRH